MLKHATITRTNRAQQSLQLQKQWENHILQLEQKQQQSGDETTLSSMSSCQSSSAMPAVNDETISQSNNNSIVQDQQTTTNDNNRLINHQHHPHETREVIPSPDWLTNTLKTLQQQHNDSQSCSSSPTPSIVHQFTPTTTTNSRFKLSSAPSSVFSSPNKFNGSVLQQCDENASINSNNKLLLSTTSSVAPVKNCSESMIKVFAQTLSQEVEYVTLHVNSQTKSSQIIRQLLKKFRQKHRDPNLFYLTLERWIRKDGLKFKSVMLLSDDACPLQLQQCCSNPPHNDIKFTLQMRSGALVKIHCSDVCPDVRYKCLSLSNQTSVDETINLMLQCLNLAGSQHETSVRASSSTPICQPSTSRLRSLAGSPGLSTDSSSTSSSSSGIESDPTNVASHHNHHHHQQQPLGRQLDSSSRASSITSISSSSNISNSSVGGGQMSEQYCLIIECKDTNYRRILESDEYLVDVYQNLLDEIRENQHPSTLSPLLSTDSASLSSSDISNHHNNSTISSPNTSYDLNRSQQPEQWFFIKLKRRNDISQQPSIEFTNPRQNMPLPPIPLSLAQHNANTLKHIVTTTQIEVNHPNKNNSLNNRHHHQSFNSNSKSHHQMMQLKQQRQQHLQQHYHWPSSSVSCLTTIPSNGNVMHSGNINGATDTVDGNHYHHQQQQQQRVDANHELSSTLELPRRNLSNHHIKQMSAITDEVVGGSSSSSDMSQPPPPERLIWLPPVTPRRRNLSNVSTSTFGRPQSGTSNGVGSSNRRRYDPAQLAEDLKKLDMSIDAAVIGPEKPAVVESTTTKNEIEPELIMPSDCNVEPAGN